ncbi:MAG: peptide/nickel transport system permease protein [Solirubrobacterales bacterium]|nr:peptide/nickel transport system permease protein [Solirubrobacterales bacterium]
MATDPQAAAVLAEAYGGPTEPGPWRLALRRFLRNRWAVAFLGLFVLIILFVLAAPLWADHVAHTGPNRNHTLEKLKVGDEVREVVNIEGQPIGPQWFEADGKFFLGADGRLGRDEMVRLMYGGRISLMIGLSTALITTALAVFLGLLAGYYRGWVDTVIARILDVIWSLPVFLIGIALGIVLAVAGLKLGPIEISAGSLWSPIVVICIFTVPYIARPIRGEVLALREKEFVEAAIAQGAGPLRVMFGELLPNLASTIIVFFTLTIANNMLFEAGLSFLGAGVQPPNSSWGSMISDGVELLSTQPLLAILPGVMIMLTVLALNIVGDGLRDALDPRSKIRLEAHAGMVEPKGASV